MGAFGDALKNAGLLSPEKAAEISASERQRELSRQAENSQAIGKLAKKVTVVAADPKDFREAAKQELLEDPDRIKDIIKQAHQFNSSKEGRRLVWEFYQLRDALAQTPDPENKKTVITRALRRSNRVFEAIN